MTHAIGDPDHIGVHNALAAPLDAIAAKWGAAVALPDAATVGDTGHVDDHNLFTQAIRDLHAEIVSQGGLVDPLPADLPTTVAAGDTGHVTAHNAIDAATAILEAARFPYNDATGGTVTEVPNYNGTGERWRVHTFTAGGTFTVTTAPQQFRVLCVAGGGGGGHGAPNGRGGGGGAGGMSDTTITVPVGTHTVTVGNGGPGNTVGGDSSLGSLVVMKGGGYGGSGGAGAPAQNGGNGGSGGGAGAGDKGGSPVGGTGVATFGNNGGNGSGTAYGNAGGGGGAGGAGGQLTVGPGKASDITGTSVVYAKGGSHATQDGNVAGTPGTDGRGEGGQGFGLRNPAGGGAKGGNGVVIVAYRIG